MLATDVGYARSAYCSTAVEEGAMRCVVLRWDMALPGDDVSIDKVSPMLLCACYAMASTDTAYRAGSGTSAGTARYKDAVCLHEVRY